MQALVVCLEVTAVSRDRIQRQIRLTNPNSTRRNQLLKGQTTISTSDTALKRAQFLKRLAERRMQAITDNSAAVTTRDLSLLRPMVWSWTWIAAVVGLFLADFISQFTLNRLDLPIWVGFYVIRPIIWLSLATIVMLLWRSDKRINPLRLSLDSGTGFSGFLVGGAQVASLTLLGVFTGFGHSPYARALLPLLGNLLGVLAIIIAVEMVRAFLIAAWGERYPERSLLLTALIMTIATLPFSIYTSFSSIQSAVETVGTRVLPTLAEQLLASLLVSLGGPVAGITYRGTLNLFEWGSPILPDPPWILLALVSTIVPVIGLVTITDLFAPEEDTEHESLAEQERESIGGLLLVGFAIVLMIWFNTGALGVQPSVLSGPSMLPTIKPADLVITKEVPMEELEVGEIIRFYQDERFVIHRIIEIDRSGEELIIVTQGDNVNSPDPPIVPEQIAGRVILVIPKGGYPSLWFREALSLLQ